MADRQHWLWLLVRWFNRNRWTTFGGFALLSILVSAERAESSGGWLKIDGCPGKGTTIEFWLPAA